MPPRRLIILGSTGSIGTQALDVVAHLNSLPDPESHIRVVGLAAGSSAELLLEQAARFGVTELALARPYPIAPGLRSGPDAALQLIQDVECDLVLAAMVGAAGLPATLAAVKLGRNVALANKETLVAAGSLVVPAARASGAKLLPVDSEHAGAWQCLAASWAGAAPPVDAPPLVRRVTLTASGGPFRTWDKSRIDLATPDMALRHPTWSMGRKITVDCASLMNKGLELIEAYHLFGLDADRLRAVIHPQSIVHAFVEYADGSTLAQLAPPDMRGPIQLALTWPRRCQGLARPLDPLSMGPLHFEPVDPARFPAVPLALDVIRAGGCAGTILNAANEAAVERFLDPALPPLPFGRITDLAADAVASFPNAPLRDLDDFFEADRAARAFVASRFSPAARHP